MQSIGTTEWGKKREVHLYKWRGRVTRIPLPKTCTARALLCQSLGEKLSFCFFPFKLDLLVFQISQKRPNLTPPVLVLPSICLICWFERLKLPA
uniref:Uncharacterized protein n=1 Tax=Populus trichocarpa TaxID=3694 RepID=A0A2K1XLV5_POPTR